MLKPALGSRDIQVPQLVQMVLENGVYPLVPQEIISHKNRNGKQGYLVQWVGGITESARGYRQPPCPVCASSSLGQGLFFR